MNELDKAFGQYLKELREIRGITQEELAFQSDMHRTYISMLERGLRSPTINTVFRLCKTLRIPVEEVIGELNKRVIRQEDRNG